MLGKLLGAKMATGTATKSRAIKAPAKRKPVPRARAVRQPAKFDASGQIKLTPIAASDTKHLGFEPTWENIADLSEEARKIAKIRAFNWYNYNCDSKQSRSFLELYFSTKEEFAHLPAKFKPLSDTAFSSTAGWLARMIMSGFTTTDSEDAFIFKTIDALEARLSKIEVPKETAPTPKKETIQDRLAEKFSEAMGEIEGAIDEFVLNKTEFSTYRFLQEQNIAVQYISKIPELIKPRIDELNELLEGKDAQLLEGYRLYSKRDIKAHIKFYESIINDAMAYKTSKIATRAKPKRKPVPPERQVRGLKYLKEFAELGLKSINPTEILGMSELWTYNTKTRKLGRFVVSMHGEMTISLLGVKGSAITGFDELKSTCKTLRKPSEKLAEFKAQGKPGLRKFMDTIKSVETKLKGRISPETILLRAIK
jgi:hypothetical protein